MLSDGQSSLISCLVKRPTLFSDAFLTISIAGSFSSIRPKENISAILKIRNINGCDVNRAELSRHKLLFPGHFTFKIHVTNTIFYISAFGAKCFIGNIYRKHTSLFKQSCQKRSIKLLCGIVQRLVAPKIINAWPWRHGPAVIQLPIYAPHTAAAYPPEIFHTVLDCVCLHKLGRIHQAFERGRIKVVFWNIIQNFGVSALAFLMIFHDLWKNIQIPVCTKTLYGFARRKAFKAKFRAKSEFVFSVIGKRCTAVPYVPIMHISLPRFVRLFKAPPHDGEDGQ